MRQTFYSNGKLLLSAEYAILDGALGLALPVRYGQWLHVVPTSTGRLQWTSLDENNAVWFQANLALNNLAVISTSDQEIAQTLATLLLEAKAQNSAFLSYTQGIAVETQINFPRLWGLGTSSTLINNIAQWAGVDAYTLLWKTADGSGYDIACAQHHHPITYRLQHGVPQVEKVAFNPPFKDSLYWVYLNQKQRTTAAVAAYRKQPLGNDSWLQDISTLTTKMIATSSLNEFETLIEQHEAIIAEVLGRTPVKAERFPEYPGALKSLGAWGGDFVLATGNQEAITYFKAKGLSTCIPYAHMVLSSE